MSGLFDCFKKKHLATLFIHATTGLYCTNCIESIPDFKPMINHYTRGEGIFPLLLFVPSAWQICSVFHVQKGCLYWITIMYQSAAILAEALNISSYGAGWH